MPPKTIRACMTCGAPTSNLKYCRACGHVAYKQKHLEANRRLYEERKNPVGIESGVNEFWCQVYLNTLLPVNCIIYPGQDFLRLVRAKQILFGFFEKWDGGRVSVVYRVMDGKLEGVREVKA